MRPDDADGLGVLMRQAGYRPVPTAAEEVRLARRIALGDQRARRELIERNLRLVFALAKPYRGCGVPPSDLVQEGTIGLAQAANRFDFRRGVRFSTYAAWWIRRSILDAIADEQSIRIPTRARRQAAAVRAAEAELRAHGAAASDQAIADRTGLRVARVRALRDIARVTASLDEPDTGDGEGSRVDRCPGELESDPAAGDGARFGELDVCSLLRYLPERQRRVLSAHYGLDGSPGRSHREIGKALGVGEERSRQLEHEALRRLREVTRGGGLAA